MTELTISSAQVQRERSAALRTAMAAADIDAWITSLPSNTQYATGYRSATLAVGEPPSCVAVATADRTVLCAPVAEWPAAVVDAEFPAADFLGYGNFNFDRIDSSPGPEPGLPGLSAAVRQAIGELLPAGARVAVDEALDPAIRAELAETFPALHLVDSGDWVWSFRSIKSAGELERMARSARLAEAGILAAIESAATGCTETELMAVVGSTMLAGGGLPQFLVVTSGPRSAHSDAYAGPRRLRRGDLVRFDVGCTVDGYWSDIGRTAVVGEPDALQATRYAAILAGEQLELELARPGLTAAELFHRAVDEVARNGLSPYRRHHCGHGIGLDVYESPIVNPAGDLPLRAGMTLCVETPYYELGWGGMMVEDTIVVTDSGCTALTGAGRELSVITR